MTTTIPATTAYGHAPITSSDHFSPSFLSLSDCNREASSATLTKTTSSSSSSSSSPTTLASSLNEVASTLPQYLIAGGIALAVVILIALLCCWWRRRRRQRRFGKWDPEDHSRFSSISFDHERPRSQARSTPRPSFQRSSVDQGHQSSLALPERSPSRFEKEFKDTQETSTMPALPYCQEPESYDPPSLMTPQSRPQRTKSQPHPSSTLTRAVVSHTPSRSPSTVPLLAPGTPASISSSSAPVSPAGSSPSSPTGQSFTLACRPSINGASRANTPEQDADTIRGI